MLNKWLPSKMIVSIYDALHRLLLFVYKVVIDLKILLIGVYYAISLFYVKFQNFIKASQKVTK